MVEKKEGTHYPSDSPIHPNAGVVAGLYDWFSEQFDLLFHKPKATQSMALMREIDENGEYKRNPDGKPVEKLVPNLPMPKVLPERGIEELEQR